MESADPALFAQVQKAYADAMAKHLWDGQYGATTAHEYWAEGTQFWFNSNKLAVIDGKSILSDADLSRHDRSEEHTSELQSLMRISYAVFCLKKKKHTQM